MLESRWRAWRLRRAEIRLADARHDFAVWGHHFGIKPSESLFMRRAIERAEAKVRALGGDPDEC